MNEECCGSREEAGQANDIPATVVAIYNSARYLSAYITSDQARVA